MSCLKCEAAQELHGAGRDTRAAYVRVGNGNVELVGCVDHVAQLVQDRRRQAPVIVHRGHQDMADRAQKALDALEKAPGPIGHAEAALALDFTRALFAATWKLDELEAMAANITQGEALVRQCHPGLLDDDPPEVEEPAADCLNCDGSGCEDCRPAEPMPWGHEL